MKLDVIQRRNMGITLRLIMYGVLIALVYPAFQDGFSSANPYINALFIGSIGGLFIAFCELDLFRNKKVFNSFTLRVVIKTLVYFVAFSILIPLVKLIGDSIYNGQGIGEHYRSQEYQTFLFDEDLDIMLGYAFFFICVIIFMREMSLKLGQGVLWNYITGKYHKPKFENRLFMYIDIRDSTKISEKLKGIEFHGFIDEFIRDLTPVILDFRGIIYRYVGDQLSITWKQGDGIRNANCIKAFIAAQNTIRRNREKYLHRYGVVPKFIASLHYGPVVIGQLGDVKSQIVYIGETVHRLGRIESQFKAADLPSPILLSGQVLEQLRLPALFEVRKLGSLEGVKEQINVFTLIENVIDKP